MYVRMLEDTVRELRGEEVPPEIHSALNLGLDLRIPPAISPTRTSGCAPISASRRRWIAAEREKVEQELADRYGPVPDDVRNLLKYSAIKTPAEKIGIEAIDRRGGGQRQVPRETKVDAEKLMALVSSTRRAVYSGRRLAAAAGWAGRRGGDPGAAAVKPTAAGINAITAQLLAAAEMN